MMSEALVHGDVHLLLFNMLYREHEEVGGNMPVDGDEDGGCKCVCVEDMTFYLYESHVSVKFGSKTWYIIL